MIGRRSNVGQPVTPRDMTKEEVKAREAYQGADMQRPWGAETAEEVLRALVREKDREIARLTAEVERLKRVAGEKGELRDLLRRSA